MCGPLTVSKSHLTFLCHLVPHQHRLGALSISIDLESKGRKFLKVKEKLLVPSNFLWKKLSVWSFFFLICFVLMLDQLYCQFSLSFIPSCIQHTFVGCWGLSGGSESKESACNVGFLGLIPGLGRAPGEGHPLQYSGLDNSMDRGAWKATVHGVAKSWTWLSDFTF